MKIQSFLKLCILLGAVVIAGCSNSDNPVTAHTSPGPENNPVQAGAVIDPNLAMQVAQDEVNLMAALSQGSNWSANARVVAAYPVFMEGIEGASYYECKVTDGGDAGYVLVNANKTDILIPESAPEGKTLSERYRAALGHDNFTVVRYSWFHSAAIDPRSGAVLAVIGYDAGSGPDVKPNKGVIDEIAVMRNAITAKDCYPLYTRDLLARSYAEAASGEEQARGSWRNIYAELSYTFKSGWHTPKWYQISIASGHPVGCGPAAWAITYAYWKHFKGKSALFNGYDVYSASYSGNSYNQDIKDCMVSCANSMGTEYGSYKDEKYGRTWPWDMDKGIAYAKSKGYRSSTCEKDNGTEYSKFDNVYNNLRNNRPAILLIGVDHWIGEHYVVIEAASKSQYKYAWVWHNRDVKYLINYGDGMTRKWICTRDWGGNQNTVTPSFSTYLINVQ